MTDFLKGEELYTVFFSRRRNRYKSSRVTFRHDAKPGQIDVLDSRGAKVRLPIQGVFKLEQDADAVAKEVNETLWD